MIKHSKEQIIRLRKEGNNYEQIRAIVGCTKSLISYHCKNEGLSSSNIFKKPSDIVIAKINLLYKEGRTITSISKEVGFGRKVVRDNILEKRFFKKKGNTISVKEWRKRTKIKLVEYLGGSCSVCGYDKCIEALAFHHKNPLEKDFTISGKSWGFEKLKAEVDKCLLVCSNCHIEIHTELNK